MQSLTILLASVLALMVFATRPVIGLACYLVAVSWYPANMTLTIGTIDFTVARIVIIALIVKILFSGNLLRTFKFNRMDALVIVFFLSQIVACVFTTSLSRLLENRLGAAFDTIIPYLAFRIIIREQKEFKTFLEAILIVGAPLAVAGMYQAITGKNVVEPLLRYATWGATSQKIEMRWGMYRSSVTFGVHILYGLYFAILGPITTCLINIKGKKNPVYIIGMIFMFVGLFASLSSGPWFAAMLAIFFFIMFKYRKHWKPIVITIVLMCAAVEVISNRHFYDVFARVAFNAATANYRSRLIQVAFFEGGMNGHWVFGYGLEASDPGWGPRIDGRGITDIVNHYILIMFLYGFPVMLIFCWILYECFKELIRAYKAAFNENMRWFIWCMMASMFGILLAMCTVSLTAQAVNILFIALALWNIAPMLIYKIRKEAAERMQLNTSK